MRFSLKSTIMLLVIGGALAIGGQASHAQAQSAPVIKVAKKHGIGAYLTDSKGRALYMFTSDGTGESTCHKQCANDWPPFIATSGKPTTSSHEVDGEDLGTIQRRNGFTQVTYLGHPLYYFSKDKASNTTAGEDARSFGGTWYLVAPSGNRVAETR